MTRWLESAPYAVFVIVAIAAAFSTYFCMYAYRRPFVAGQYEHFTLWGLDLKVVLVISQTLGYWLSKFLGVKFGSEVVRQHRARMLVGMILFAQLTLVLFAVLPMRFKAVAMFFNGVPLGMVWGLVVFYLEGRRVTEVLIAGLSCAYVVASGMVIDVGRWVMNALHVTEWWMPAVVGFMFLPMFCASVWILSHLPRPSAVDEARRARRQPMNGPQRWAFFKRFWLGLSLSLLLSFILTAIRDFRVLYGVEVFSALGYADRPAVFSRVELCVALGVMAAMATLSLIRNNRFALMANFAIMSLGVIVLGMGTYLRDLQAITGFAWMVSVGLGTYLILLPQGTIFYDRLVASSGLVGTAVFLAYLGDGVGYTGSILLQLYKAFGHAELSYFSFLRGCSYAVAALGALIVVFNSLYFWIKVHEQPGGKSVSSERRAGQSPATPSSPAASTTRERR